MEVAVPSDYLNKQLKKFGGVPVVTFWPIDVEGMTFGPYATHNTFAAVLPFVPTSHVVHLNVTVPIHLRYQAPSSQHLFHAVAIFQPSVYISCQELQPASCSESVTHLWIPFFGISYWGEGDVSSCIKEVDYVLCGEVIELLVPVGKLQDRVIVNTTTFGITFLAALWILIQLYKTATEKIKIK